MTTESINRYDAWLDLEETMVAAGASQQDLDAALLTTMRGPRRAQPLPFASVRTILAQQVNSAGGQAAWARKHDIQRSVVCDVLAERREPSEIVINALGYVVCPMLIPMREMSHVG